MSIANALASAEAGQAKAPPRVLGRSAHCDRRFSISSLLNMQVLYACTLLCGFLFSSVNGHADTLEVQGIGGQYAVSVSSLKQLRYRATMRQQFDFSCGSAAIATLLSHQYGDPVTEQVVFEGMYGAGDQQKIRRDGFSLLDMQRFLGSRGYLADGFVQPLEKLTEAGLPAIVLIAEKGYHHFVVLKGIRDGRVLIGDPALGTRAMARASFEAVWVNHLLFVIHNRQEMAVFNNANDWRAAPIAPLANLADREGILNMVLPKFGPGDF